jgi:hypothetical protein
MKKIPATSKPPAKPKKPVQRIQAGEDKNFLCFAAALKILVGSSVRIDALKRAEDNLKDYLLKYLKVRVLFHESLSLTVN